VEKRKMTMSELFKNRSENIGELAAAMAKAQGEMKGALKDSSNPFFKSKYADLSAVMEAIREPFAKNGLAYVQSTRMEGERLIMETTIIHSSNQWWSTEYPVTPKEFSPQAIGSAITYARRYSLSSIAGVAQVDDDGEAAEGRKSFVHGAINPNAKNVPPQPRMDAPADNDERIEIGKKIVSAVKTLGLSKEAFNNWALESSGGVPQKEMTIEQMQDFLGELTIELKKEGPRE
jgi:hypothetical protein